METELQRKDRVARCVDKITKALEEEHCILEPSITLLGGKISDTQVIVQPNRLPEVENVAVPAPVEVTPVEPPVVEPVQEGVVV